MDVNFKVDSGDRCCCSTIDFKIDEDKTIHNVVFKGGCKGNQVAVSRLVEGKTVDELKKLLCDVTCPGKRFSCCQELVMAICKASKQIDEEVKSNAN